MPRTHHRRRRPISVRRARLLTLVGFRYSTTRDAYVMRGVGGWVGPVYQVESRLALTAESPVAETETAHASVETSKL
jgi:hypothetical protein